MTLSILLCESQQTPPLLHGCWSMILEKRAPPKSFHFSRGRCTLRLLVQRLYGQKYPQFFRLLDQGPYIQVLVYHGAQNCILLARAKKCSSCLIKLLETYLPGECPSNTVSICKPANWVLTTY